jgi:hypothetical protein
LPTKICFSVLLLLLHMMVVAFGEFHSPENTLVILFFVYWLLNWWINCSSSYLNLTTTPVLTVGASSWVYRRCRTSTAAVALTGIDVVLGRSRLAWRCRDGCSLPMPA